MFLFSHSANLEIDVPAAASWVAPRQSRGEPLEFTIDGIDFEITASGFGSRKSALEGALCRVQFLMAACTADELQDHAVIDAVAATAVRRETKTWRCWRRNFRGTRPALDVRAI